MSNQSPFAGRTAQAFPTLPKGDVLGTYDSYPDAQRVVAKLAEADFPVNQLSIVGNDLKTVERVTGKMTYGRAAIAGALSGLWLGIFFGIVLTLFSPSAGGLILAAAIIGAAFGMLYGIVSFAITKRQRDFTSVHQVLATNYQIVVNPQLTGQAQRILGEHGATPSTHWNDAPQQQQQWSPGPGGVPPQQQSPYGGHATPHQQPGGPQHSGTSAPGAQTGASSGPPRYGTNDGPRYGETPETAAAPAAPPVPERRPEEPPRYGERVAGATPPEPSSSPDAPRDGDGSSDRR
ncbi:ECF transporter S component [Curtobacterium flaccumfaciens pv. flaccumfaciens]|uniref:general stress protein n=1 Tax=Curtobacterium flaccumfaciens TaxID=2035 RepID=UPI00217DBC34|nr:general stress protein [Curtobacterium flaccumfaciens]MCS6569199.1 ECF transporter S component [Curtobacterium flaccumfaciens pv. flaccumfaciens]MCS6585048.1 ECF transporter S component [Curtobacterium flaccumfaciens pv. flaccumfaciens]